MQLWVWVYDLVMIWVVEIAVVGGGDGDISDCGGD